MEDEQTTYTYFVLSIKGGFYDSSGAIVEEIGAAKFFQTKEQARMFRKIYDPKHRVDCSGLIAVQMLASEVGDEEA
jgi:hypothetical protein